MWSSKILRNSSLGRWADIGFKIDIVIDLWLWLIPVLGQTYPEFIAIGWQEIFNFSYIFDAPFLNGGLSCGKTLVPWGKIIIGLLVMGIAWEIFS